MQCAAPADNGLLGRVNSLTDLREAVDVVIGVDTHVHTHSAAWRTPVIVYRAVVKYRREDLRNWIAEQDPRHTLTVMVGAASGGATPAVSLADAQAMRAELNPNLLLGGVAIPERHSRRENEHVRLIAKQEAGCRP